MSDFLDRISKLSPQRLALLADELNERVHSLEKTHKVPLAIVGIGCRFPGGVDGPDSFWKLLSEGVDAIREVPPSRWDIDEFYDPNPKTPGRMATRWGGFIAGHDQFDPKFFGIAPAEAVSMDPQQRLLLETAWEALEHAGIAPSSLAGTQTGVFAGICNGDYGHIAMSSPREKISPYFAPGLSHAVAAGRISYVLGLQGPNLAVDTSCSSSLVAVHLACQSLRLGECSTALAAGVNLILNPEVTIALSQSRMMAADGQCKAFSESANGFVRGEGCGVIVLKRLPDAIRDRNRILSVVRGSACNQDGRSSGLTAPNGPSQEMVIAAALANASLRPDDVDYIEAHGTGTSLGDPIEAGALNAAFAGRTSAPLFIGSVKTNIGHLESAAGIAGLIKLVLSLQHAQIPASLHFQTPSSRIEWDRLPLQVPTQLQPWSRRGDKRVGGVSSFGFSGTNAHVIVEEYPHRTQQDTIADRPYLFTISARTGTALKTVAGRLHHHLSGQPSLPLADVARTLNTGRSHFEHRAALAAATHSELLHLLAGFQKNDPIPAIQTGRAAAHSPRVAFVFAGEHFHESDMGRELYKASPIFRASLKRCEDFLRSDYDQPLISLLYPDDISGTFELPGSYVPPAVFAVQYALAELWRSCGIEPSAVLGHGVGEYVAACVAGIINLRDGLRFAVARGRQNHAEIEECARSVTYNLPRISFVSEDTRVNSAEYWLPRLRSNALSPSLFASLAQEGCAAYIYMNDSLTLQEFVSNLPGKWLPSLRTNRDGRLSILDTAAALYVLGCEPDMSGLYREADARVVTLPTYPFERERYWLDVEAGDRSSHLASALPLAKENASGVESTRFDQQLVEASEWAYDLVWEPKPLPADAQAQKFEEGFLGKVAVPQADAEVLHYAGLSRRLDPVCTTYIIQALQEIGLGSLPRLPFTVEELCEQLKVAVPRRGLFARLLAILIEDGLVARSGEEFLFTEFRERSAVEAELQKLEAVYPQCQTEINILRRCGKDLAAVLRGVCNPVHLLFPNGSMDEVEHVYRHSPIARFYNKAVCDVVEAAVGHGSGRAMRILEIGAGTGATTASILPALAGKNVEYTFTDISPAFASRARGIFANTPSLRCQVLDIENDPVEQGFECGGYDIVIAANVLHATSDLRRTVSHVRKLLAPSGLLLLVEGCRPDRSVDLTFGLTDGWWRFVDHDLRSCYPLLSAASWTRLLGEEGMNVSRTIAYAAEDGSISQQTLIAAQAAPSMPQYNAGRRWLVLGDEFGVGTALHRLLTARGERCEIIRRQGSADELDAVLSMKGRSESDPTEVVYLWGSDAGEMCAESCVSLEGLRKSVKLCGNSLIHLIQTLLKSANHPAHLWMVTRGAQATESFSPGMGGAVQSLVWGIGRVFGLETPEQYRGLIDLDPALTPETAAAALLGELLAGDVEDQVAYRGSQRLAARIRNSSFKCSPAKELRADSSYLITGGLGGVGLQLANWAAVQRPGHLVLLNRTGMSAGRFAAERSLAIERLRALEVNVTVIEGDVASEAEMKGLFQRFGRELPPLRGIFHAATAFSSAEITQLTDEETETMLRPKVLGTWVLHELTKALDLDFFVVFSSAASLLGAKRMAHYAAANQFLDSFAHYRRAAGLPMLSVNWGAWEVQRLASQEQQSNLKQTGFLPMPSAKTLRLVGELLASQSAQVMIANIDWGALKATYEVRKVRPMLEGFGNARSKHTRASAGTVPSAASLRPVIGMTPEGREKSIEAFVLDQAARVLGFRNGELPPADVPLTEMGLDSLMAVDLRNRLQSALGQELPPTIVFDYPTVSGMVEMLETMLWAAHGSAQHDLAPSLKDEISI